MERSIFTRYRRALQSNNWLYWSTNLRTSTFHFEMVQLQVQWTGFEMRGAKWMIAPFFNPISNICWHLVRWLKPTQFTPVTQEYEVPTTLFRAPKERLKAEPALYTKRRTSDWSSVWSKYTDTVSENTGSLSQLHVQRRSVWMCVLARAWQDAVAEVVYQYEIVYLFSEIVL
jgi:hypothetical protein